MCYKPTLCLRGDTVTMAFAAVAPWRHVGEVIGVLMQIVVGRGRGGGDAFQIGGERVRASRTQAHTLILQAKELGGCPTRASHDLAATAHNTTDPRATGVGKLAPALVRALVFSTPTALFVVGSRAFMPLVTNTSLRSPPRTLRLDPSKARVDDVAPGPRSKRRNHVYAGPMPPL